MSLPPQPMQIHPPFPAPNLGPQNPALSTDGNSDVVSGSSSDFARSIYGNNAQDELQTSRALPKHLSAFLCINLDSHQSPGHSFVNTNKTDLDIFTRPQAQAAAANQVTIPITVPASLLAPITPSAFAPAPTEIQPSYPVPPQTPTRASLNDHSSWLDQWFSSEANHKPGQSFSDTPMPAYKYEAYDDNSHPPDIPSMSANSSFSTPTLPSKQITENYTDSAFTEASTSLTSLSSRSSEADVEAWKVTLSRAENLEAMSPRSRLNFLTPLEGNERRLSTLSLKRNFKQESELSSSDSEYPQKRRYIRGRCQSADDPSTRLARYPTDFDRTVEPSYVLTEEPLLEPRSCDTNQAVIPYPGIGQEGEQLLQVCNKPEETKSEEEAITQQEPSRKDDFYTPHWTRYEGDARQGWCRFCREQRSCWYSIKRSQYMYHLQYCHGISSRTRRPYDPPQKLMIFNDRNRTTAGLCEECNEWVSICYGSTRRISWTAWYKHAHKCHNS